MDVDDISTIAVLGAGSMGHGIAEVAALAGYDVRLRDINEEFVQNGYDQIEWSLGKLAEKQQISDAEADATLDRIEPLVDLEAAVDDVDVVIEAVPEKMAIKREVYADLETYAPDRTIFATNTSSLSITELSEATDRPAQFCGMHFFNPPVRMPLVEVVAGAHSDDATLDAIEALAERMDKTPVRVHKDEPGFIVNRVLVPLMNEAAWLVHDDAATIAEVDSTTKFGVGLPMGSFELADQVGIDVGYHVLEYMHETLGDRYEPCPLLAEKVEAEELGQKSGRGFYDYEDGDGADVPHDQVREDLQERLVAAMANEVAALVANDVAAPDAIDRAVQLGAGFPDGPAAMADDAGLARLLDRLEALYEETGAARYEPRPYLRELVADGTGFHGDGDGDSDGDGEAADDSDGADGGPDYETIRLEYEADGRVAHIVLDRPHRLNTITLELTDELEAAVDHVTAEEGVRAILVTGAGDRAFSAGADIQASASAFGDNLKGTEISRAGQAVCSKLEAADCPVLMGVDGYCLGGGMEIAMAGDMRIASRRSEFGQPEHNLGLLPGWGGTQRLQRIVGVGRAKEIIFTADRYEAETMADYGLVNEVTDNDALLERAIELATDLANGPPVAQRLTKRAMHRGWGDMEAGLEIEAQGFGHLFSTDDLAEGATAFMGDRDPEFEGH